jgi:hypothetical protein
MNTGVVKKTIAILGLLGLTIFFGCAQPTSVKTNDSASSENVSVPDTEPFEIRGSIVYKDLEGGFFAIKGDDGRIYDPINLPEAFKKDGLRVKANARLKKDVGSIHMVGDIIEIVDIAAE